MISSLLNSKTTWQTACPSSCHFTGRLTSTETSEPLLDPASAPPEVSSALPVPLPLPPGKGITTVPEASADRSTGSAATSTTTCAKNCIWFSSEEANWILTSFTLVCPISCAEALVNVWIPIFPVFALSSIWFSSPEIFLSFLDFA